MTGRRKLTLRTTRVALPPAIKAMSPGKIVSIQQHLNVSQPMFARLLNVPVVTAVSWEKGRRRPSGAALRLLEIASHHPEVIVEPPVFAVAREPRAPYGSKR